MKTIAFFNNKGGVGKTTLVYHLAWMYHELGLRVLALDLDPQSNLTTAFLPLERLEEIWPLGVHPETILGTIQPLMDRLGDIAMPPVECVGLSLFSALSLVPGDLGLSLFEDRLSEAWPRCQSDNQAEAADAFRVMSAFYRIMARAAAAASADLVLIDVGPNLGAINRAALVASDFVVVPLGADLFSLQGLRNLGPTLAGWRRGWQKRLDNDVRPRDLLVPSGQMLPVGYVIVQPVMRQDRPAKAYRLWIDRIPQEYRRQILGREDHEIAGPDPHMLATVRHYLSLMPLAQEARKPMFALKPADGAIGSHAAAAQDCRRDFQNLALRIADAAGVDLSTSSTHRLRTVGV